MFTLFRSRSTPEQESTRRLAELEARAASASPGYQSHYWIQAGDLAARLGDAPRALGCFGRALDAYLESGRLDAADALCRRMLEAAPDAVRVRGTLMWLAAARGTPAEVRAAIGEYVRVGFVRSQDPLLVYQLRLLAEASPAPEVREAVADALLGLGAEEDANRLFGDVFAGRNGLQSSAPTLTEHEWGERMLEATLMPPERVLETLRAERERASGPEEELRLLAHSA